jgi:hypothetical protein
LNKRIFSRFLIGFLLVILAAGCSSTTSSTQAVKLIRHGSWYSREKWPHDGEPYESQNFIIYSDGASTESREEVALIAEELLAELIVEFGIDPDEMFRYPPDQDKIHIYSYKEYYPQQWGMRAYYGGIIAWSLDHNERPTNLAHYKPVLKHELVHVVESLLKGRDVANMDPAIRTQAWFSEGLAEAVVGGTSGNPVSGREQFEVVTAQYGNLNPIAYKTDGVLDLAHETHPMIGFNYYYPMSQLAVEYLLAPDGLGKSLFDVRDIFLDMADGVDFSTAFETHMGMPVQAYEADFFDLMDSYLSWGKSYFVRRAVDLWVVLSLVSFFLIAWMMFRGNQKVQDMRWGWLALAAFFGPLGLIMYLVSRRNQELNTSRWWRGLVAALFSSAGKGVGLLAVILFFRFITPDANSGPLTILVPFLVGWMIFRAPQIRSRKGVSYWIALCRSVLGELGSTLLVLAGMLPVLIILPEKTWFFSADPAHPNFWGLVSLSAIAGTVIVYLFCVWVEGRDSSRNQA